MVTGDEWSAYPGAVRTVFGEVVVPLVAPENNIPGVERFSLDISGRIDSYSDFGEADTYKIGASWDVIESAAVTLR